MVLYTKNRTDVPIWHGKHILKSATKPVTLCVHFVVHVCKKTGWVGLFMTAFSQLYLVTQNGGPLVIKTSFA